MNKSDFHNNNGVVYMLWVYIIIIKIYLLVNHRIYMT